MAWIVQNIMEGPVELSDFGISLVKGSTRDLDIFGRATAEASNHIKVALQKGWIKTIRKTTEDGKREVGSAEVPAHVIKDIKDARDAATDAAKTATSNSVIHAEFARKLDEKIEAQGQRLDATSRQTTEILSNVNKVLDEVRAFVSRHPIEAKAYAEAMRNVSQEQKVVRQKIDEIPESGASDAEMQMHSRILGLRSQKLEINAAQLGNTVSVSAKDMGETLDAMEQLGM